MSDQLLVDRTLDDAVIGIMRIIGRKPIIVYDYDKAVALTTDTFGGGDDAYADALETVGGAYCGEGTPGYVTTKASIEAHGGSWDDYVEECASEYEGYGEESGNMVPYTLFVCQNEACGLRYSVNAEGYQCCGMPLKKETFTQEKD